MEIPDSNDQLSDGLLPGETVPHRRPSFAEGSRLGPFTVMEELGRGGMGTVFRARDEAGREIALKLLARKVLPETLKRFQREGEVAAALDHPGLAKVLSAGEVAGWPYLAYELVPDARDLLEATDSLPTADRIELVCQAADALGHAHARGVVHRDVKAENLLVDRQGRLHVVDFGLALPPEEETLTQAGTIVGTPSHMSPEQVAGSRELLGPPLDVWALGVVLYNVLTREPPFQGFNLTALGTAIREANPRPPSQLQPLVSAAIEAVCLEALSRLPEDRYPDCRAMAAALRAAQS